MATSSVAETDKKVDIDSGTVVDQPQVKTDVGDAADNYPHGAKLALIITALCMAVFLVALDQTIIAPALGAITSQFNSVKDIVGCAPCMVS